MIEMNLIAGLMLGFEYIGAGEVDEDNHVVVDILFARFVITWQYLTCL